MFWCLFANRREPEEGFVVNIKETSSYQVKDIKQVDEIEYISNKKYRVVAKWMARRYFCNISDCIKLMLPPGTTTKVIENRVKEKECFICLFKRERKKKK